MSAAELQADVVILVCAISAGIHAALVPGHGLPFVLAAAGLACLVVWLTLRPGSRPALAAAALALGGLLGAYALTVTTGLPLLHPQPEPVDGLALATKAIEAAGLLSAVTLYSKGTMTWTAPGPRAPSRSG